MMTGGDFTRSHQRDCGYSHFGGQETKQSLESEDPSQSMFIIIFKP